MCSRDGMRDYEHSDRVCIFCGRPYYGPLIHPGCLGSRPVRRPQALVRTEPLVLCDGCKGKPAPHTCVAGNGVRCECLVCYPV